MTAVTALLALRSLARGGVLAVLATLLLAAAPATSLAAEGGAYTFQCFCPLEWDETWDGNGVFDEDASLDTVALVNGSAVLLFQELPLDAGTLEEMVEDRTAALEDAVAAYDETVVDEDAQDWVLVGRTWENADGDTMLSVQYVQVWEVDFLLSIEFVAPEADFVDQWETLEDVLLVGLPVLDEFDGEDLFEELA